MINVHWIIIAIVFISKMTLNACRVSDIWVGELYAQANPLTYAHRALVAAYHLQAIQGSADFDAMTVNTGLKHLGHGVPNITQALNELKARKPQLVIQLQKSGKSKQARKRYKVTSAGQAEVRRMLSQQEET